MVLSFARNFSNKYGKKLMNTAIKAGTNFNSKYGKKLTDTAIETGKDFATIAGKKIVHKSAEATGDLTEDEVVNGIPKERYISPKERQKIIDELKLA